MLDAEYSVRHKIEYKLAKPRKAPWTPPTYPRRRRARALAAQSGGGGRGGSARAYVFSISNSYSNVWLIFGKLWDAVLGSIEAEFCK